MQQRVLDVVAREHRERPLGGQLSLQERLRDATRPLARCTVLQRTPAARTVALGEEHALGRLVRPQIEPLGDLLRIAAERMRRAQEHAAVGAALHVHVARPESDLPGGSAHVGLA